MTFFYPENYFIELADRSKINNVALKNDNAYLSFMLKVDFTYNFLRKIFSSVHTMTDTRLLLLDLHKILLSCYVLKIPNLILRKMFTYQQFTLKNVFCNLKEWHDKIRLENIEDYLKANLSMMSVHKIQINV